MGEADEKLEVRVKLFGPEARTAGVAEVSIFVGEGARASAVPAGVERACPALRGRLGHCRVAVNHAFAGDEALIGPGDEVALIGLVSGG